MITDSATQAAIATSRYGFGARAGELATAGHDPRGWLLAQLRTPYRAPRELDTLASGREILATFLAARATRAAQRDRVKQAAEGVRAHLLPHYLAQATARTRIAITSDGSFRERLVHFWSNHFAVSIDKPICLGTAGSLENEAIRPRIDGRFVDLLLSVERHPAMITYLDNQHSTGPNSELGARLAPRSRGPARGRHGLNENLAREILELHTLGVGSGYTQADVTSFAAVISGWSIGGGEGRFADGEPGAFIFRPALHEPGSKTVFGRHYADAGIAQGQAVLIDRLARAYGSSDGHLPTVYDALVSWDGAWQREPQKFKQPQEFVYSALRALEVTAHEPKALLAPFEVLGQRHWSPGSPAGWPDRQADWDGADALMKRVEWSVAFADRLGDAHSAIAAADLALGPLASAHTRRSIDNAASGSQGLALLLMSPEFQRR